MNRRRIQLKCVLPLIITVSCRLAFSAMYSGTIVDHDTKKPVAGALVSLGYSLYRTTTDSVGRFSLDIPAEAVRPQSLVPRTPPMLSIIWNTRQHSVDLTNAPEVSAIALYRLDGSRVFYKTFTTGGRIAALPYATPGIYLAAFTRSDNSSFVRRLAATPGQGAQVISALSHSALKKTAAAAATGTPLIFRHDNYFPLDQVFSEPSDNLQINMSADPQAYVFDQSEVRSYYFTVTKADSLLMERNARDEEFIPADFSYNGTAFGKVGLRYKGSVYTIPHCFDTVGNRSSFPECRNVALKVKFNEYNDSLRFYALKKLNLHAMPYDDGKLREMLAYQVFRDMGMYTCRTAFAKVYINNVFRGLFTAVEEIDGRFTKSRWPGFGDGNLYKEAWPFRLNRTYYREALKTNDKPEDSANVNRMVDFYRAITASTTETFSASISPFMDLDYFVRYIVVDRAIHNSDGIMTWYTEGNWMGNHNFYFYEEENAGGKLWLVPWDLNITFSETDDIVDGFGLPEWNVAPDSCEPVVVWGGSLAIPPNCDKLTNLTAATQWEKFVKYGEQFLSSIFTVEKMKAHIDRLSKLIEPVMADEPTVKLDDWKDEVKYITSAMEVLHEGFDDYLHDRAPKLDTAGFFDAFPGDSGLVIGRVNNFEFDTGVSMDGWAFSSASDSSTISLVHNTVAPLWGKADMLGSFVFNPIDSAEPYAEWAYAGFGFNKRTDCSKLKRIRMDLRCDVPRYCHIYLESDVYDSADVSDRYGWYGIITAGSRQYTFEMKNIAYPSWADADNPDILDSVKTSVSGIGFNPNARFDDVGKLKVVPDSGYIHIDNIIFDF